MGRLAQLTAVATVLLVAAPPAQAGLLAFGTAPALPALPAVMITGAGQTATAQMSTFSVSDATLSGAGWNVTATGNSAAGKSPVFARYCPSALGCAADPQGYVGGGYALPANSLTLNSSGVTFSGGIGTAPSMTCNSGCSVDSAAAVKVASAPAGGGSGVWLTSAFGAASISLAVPASIHLLPAGEVYHVDVVWTLGSGP